MTRELAERLLERVEQPCIDPLAVSQFSMKDQRTLALFILYMYYAYDNEVTLGSIIDDLSRGYCLDIHDDGFIVRLVRGVVAQQDHLDERIKPFLVNWRFERLSVMVQTILRMATFELQEKAVPTNVVINEAIELAKQYAEDEAYKFINGVLDEVKTVV